MDAGALCILVALAAVVAVKFASVIRCARLESALSASAAQALLARDDVAAIVMALHAEVERVLTRALSEARGHPVAGSSVIALGVTRM